MIRVAIDTNAYAGFKRGDADLVEVLAAADVIGVSAVVLGELLGGFAAGNRAERNRRELDDFLATSRVRTLSIDRETARWYARVYAGLRSAGRPIPTNDLWIAATSLQNGLALVTRDRHFAQIDGLIAGARLDLFLP
jgi:predicted nucleic acid-binding protein